MFSDSDTAPKASEVASISDMLESGTVRVLLAPETTLDMKIVEQLSTSLAVINDDLAQGRWENNGLFSEN